eukprot:jgi/Tetstr1/462582/TSEL_007568.t1
MNVPAPAADETVLPTTNAEPSREATTDTGSGVTLVHLSVALARTMPFPWTGCQGPGGRKRSLSAGGAGLLLLLTIAGDAAGESTPDRQRWRGRDLLGAECVGAVCGGRTGTAPGVGGAAAASSSAPGPVEAPVDQVDRVLFTSFPWRLSDNVGVDQEAFLKDYIAAVKSSVRLVGITSNPTVSIMDVEWRLWGGQWRLAVDTLVTFVNDSPSAELLSQVLNLTPSLIFPVFSSLGGITITDYRYLGDGQSAAPGCYDGAPSGLDNCGCDGTEVGRAAVAAACSAVLGSCQAQTISIVRACDQDASDACKTATLHSLEQVDMADCGRR